MSKTRLEAFSDGVIAIIITIMVLELKVPHEPTWDALRPLAPVFCAYLLSFVFVGIYWNNHHHMLHAANKINGNVLWANLHLLFWLSLVPFVTNWMGENHLAKAPTTAYGIVLLCAAAAYTLLQNTIIAAEGPESRLRHAVGNDRKGKASLGLYATALLLAQLHPYLAVALYVAVALIWLIPDRRIEGKLGSA